MAALVTTAATDVPPNLPRLVSAITTLLQRLDPKNPSHSSPPDTSILNKFSPYLTHDLVIETINSQTNPYHSLFFFNWASSLSPNPNHYFHNHHCYIAITDKLLSRRLFAWATKLLESHHRLSDFMVSNLIKAHGDLGHLRCAIKLFHGVRKTEKECCLFSFNSLLGVFVKANRVDLAWKFFGNMIKKGDMQPDISTCTIMIRGFCKAGMLEHAQKVFDEMGMNKNVVTYNTMVNGFCKKGLMEKAQTIVDEMVDRGIVLPNVVTYCTLIDGYCRKGQIVEAMRCFDEMASRNCEPNMLTYNALIHGLCLNGNVDEARRMMARVRLSGFRDDIVMHTSLLKGYCIAGRSNEAIKHFKEMVSLGMILDEKTCDVIVKEYCKTKRPNDAIALLSEMRARGVNPCVSTLNYVLSCLVELAEADKAILLIKQMPQLGCHPNFLSYNTLICSLVKSKGRMREVEMLMNDMVGNGHAPDATMYSCLVKGYCEDGNEEMAVRVLREMIDKRLVINLDCFAVFAKEFCAKGKVFEVENLFLQMKSNCSMTDLNSYQKILNEHLSRSTNTC
nr:pentatricopeptide repeat-containing protein At4g11690-like [Ipomoea batatas]